MPITQSAKKALRGSQKKRVFNIRRNDAMKDSIKEIRKLAGEKKMKEALALLPKAFQAIDKAAKTHFINKNAASRKKARLAALIKKIA